MPLIRSEWPCSRGRELQIRLDLTQLCAFFATMNKEPELFVKADKPDKGGVPGERGSIQDLNYILRKCSVCR
jgi:hypothetical protein